MLLILIGLMVIRSIIGPRSTDRIVAVNMLGTMTICSISILSVMLGEGYLADVALIYAMISFVAVLMMASMFIPPKPTPPTLKKEKRAAAAAAADAEEQMRARDGVPGGDGQTPAKDETPGTSADRSAAEAAPAGGGGEKQ